jgi:hypothetical protein
MHALSRYECFDNTGQRTSITEKIMSRLSSTKKSTWAHALSWWCVGTRLLPKYDLEWRVRGPESYIRVQAAVSSMTVSLNERFWTD